MIAIPFRVNRLSFFQGIGAWTLLGFLAYVLLYDNATSMPTAAGYLWTRLITIPRQVRFLEIFTILGLFILMVSRPKLNRMTLQLLLGCVLFMFMTLLSILFSPLQVSMVDSLRLAYMFILPCLIFIIARETPAPSLFTQTLTHLLLIWVAASAALSWYQWLCLRYYIGDSITGLAKDAHTNANLMVITSLLLASNTLYRHQRQNWILVIGLLITSLLSSSLKTTLLGGMAYCVLLYIYTREKGGGTRRLISALVLLLAISIIIYFVFPLIDDLSAGYLPVFVARVFSNPLDSLGPIGAHQTALKVLMSNPGAILVGMGPFSMANPISVGQILTGGALSQYAANNFLAAIGDHGDAARITLTSSLIMEFGLVSFLMIVMLYGSIGRNLWRCCNSHDLVVRMNATAVTACFFLLFSMSFITLFGSIDVISQSWVVMLFAGQISRRGAVANTLTRRQAIV